MAEAMILIGVGLGFALLAFAALIVVQLVRRLRNDRY